MMEIYFFVLPSKYHEMVLAVLFARDCFENNKMFSYLYLKYYTFIKTEWAYAFLTRKKGCS